MESSSARASESGSKRRVFELTGGHPALDLVNTLDWRFRDSGPAELLEDYDDLIRFLEQTGLLSSADGRMLLRSVSGNKAAKVLSAVRELREAAADLLYAVVDGNSPSAHAVKQLETYITAARQQEQLRWSGGKLEWKLIPSTSLPGLPLWLLSLSTADLMTSERMHLLRECGNAECRWLFIDTSKNHTRRWCDMKICGNRMKARRFKAQHKH